MSKIRRKFSPEDRYSIVVEALREGHSETCRKYNLSPSLLRKWRDRAAGAEVFEQGQRRIEGQLSSH